MSRIQGANLQFILGAQLLGAQIENLVADPATPAKGLVWYRSDLNELRVGNGSSGDTFLKLGTRLDQLAAPTAAVAFNGQRATGLADPTGAQDAATRAYVDAFAQGLAWKDSVRAATTANGALASAYANGSVIDGVTLATGDRILVRAQTAGADNGIYTVNASGAPTRATDADTAGDVRAATTLVEEGTSLANTLWTQTADAVTLGTTALVWAQVGSGTLPTAGAGLTLTGQTLDVVAADGSITVAADTVTVGNVPVAKGGTGATTATAARTNLAAVGKFAADITGDGSATQFTVTHNLGTTDIGAPDVWDVTANALIETDVDNRLTNSVRIGFASAPASGKVYRVVCIG